MKVLIVDDSKFMRVTIKNICQNNGIEVIGEAENGDEAVAKYKELNPDVVTMDLTMPQMRGVEAIEEIISLNPNANIIVCSALGQEPLVVEAIKAGAKSFLVKPIDEVKLVEEINKFQVK